MKACPFCGHDELDFGRVMPDREGVPVFICCETCGAQGPLEYMDKQNFNSDKSILHAVARISRWDDRAAS